MKLGTVVQLPDGRRGTVVYHGLDGYGIAWGEHSFSPEQIERALGANPLFGEAPPDYGVPLAGAMLRAGYPGADPRLEYVGREFEIVRVP